MATGKINTAKFKKRLIEERDRILSQMGHGEIVGDEGGSQDDARGELSHYDDHVADSATETFEREKDLAIDDSLKLLLEQVNAALAKIDDGTYGQCDRCHRPIAPGRMEAIPYATLCIECAERLEGR
jgi:RNA polymerase-binding protein DksA